MDRRKITFILILLALVLVYIIAELSKPKEIDWSAKFDKKSKDPYSCYVLHDKLSELVSASAFEDNNIDLYRALDVQEPNKTSLCIITSEFNPVKTDLNALLNFVSKGNKAFVAAQYFNGKFGDTLKVESTYNISESVDAANKLTVTLVNPNISKPTTFTFNKIAPSYFSKIDTTHTIALEKDKKGRITYVKVKFGKGYFFLHANPLLFTNYHILYNSTSYPSRSLAYLANRKVIWDEYYKPGRVMVKSGSPIRYILLQKPLRYAYFLFVITWILFVIFKGKRLQRVIPIYQRPSNQSLQFIETVGQLYYNQRNNKDIVDKKIAHFAEYIYSSYFLKFHPESQEFRKEFADKSDTALMRVNKVFDMLLKLQKEDKVTDTQLIAFIIEIDKIQYKNQRLITK